MPLPNEAPASEEQTNATVSLEASANKQFNKGLQVDKHKNVTMKIEEVDTTGPFSTQREA